MYQIISFILLIVPSIILYHILNKRGIHYTKIYKNFSDGLKYHFTGLIKIRKNELIRSLHHFKHLLYHLTILQASILMLTGFIPVIFLDQHIFGIFLLIHVLIAPFFCVSVALLVLLFANKNIFAKEDVDLISTFNKDKIESVQSSLLIRKISFWIFAFFSMPAIFSIVLSMYPLFGTEGQNNLLAIHRVSVLIISVAVLVHSYFLLQTALPDFSNDKQN